MTHWQLEKPKLNIEIREQDNLSIQSSIEDHISHHRHPEFQILISSNPENPEEAALKKGQQKKRMPHQPFLSEEQKQLVADEMSDANLGPLCTVCGKIFKSKDALDFHIMYTKLPGHDVLQQQKLKNTFAQEAMRVSAKLQLESASDIGDYGPPTPIHMTFEDQPPTPLNMEAEQVFDAKTGVFVKAEAEAKPDLMMPPPAKIPKIQQKADISSKSKIFKCMECHRGFKREIKLIKHVSKKHSKAKKEATSSSSRPAQHVEGALKLTPMGCPDCTLIFASEEDMMTHFSSLPEHEVAQPNKCPVMTCDMSFPNKSKLLEHLKIGKHGQPCPQCGKSFPKVQKVVRLIMIGCLMPLYLM